MRLHAPARCLAALADFYGSLLGLERLAEVGADAFAVGPTRLEFLLSQDEPFYHFAVLAPGNRFGELLAWARERVALLPDGATGEVVFASTAWGSRACYFHDPAGNIVEAIAHAGVGHSGVRGPFAASELLGISELGLVGDTAALASLLGRKLGLELWDGTVEVEGRLAFVGERARTLILSPVGRPWVPTGRAAEVHPVEAMLSGPPAGEALLDDSRSRICRR